MDEPEIKFARAKAWFKAHRRRLATAVLVLLVAVVVIQIGSAVPRDTEVALPLGAGHASVVEARIDYLQEREPVRSITLRWPSGAPDSIRDTFNASPGDYEVELELIDREGNRRNLAGRLSAPADGVVQLAMREQ